MAWKVKISAQEIGLLLEAGFIYRYAGKFDKAREIFKGVRALRPKDEVPQIALGTVSFEEGQFDRAVEEYKQAIGLNPRSAYAYAQLGEAQMFLKQYSEASISLRKAAELDQAGEFGRFARSLLSLKDKIEAS